MSIANVDGRKLVSQDFDFDCLSTGLAYEIDVLSCFLSLCLSLPIHIYIYYKFFVGGSE